MKICGFLQVYNELEKGNLKRCITNLKKYCNYIVAFDDGSTDGSADYLIEQDCLVLRGYKNDFLNETKHKQQLLDFALKRYSDIDFFFWLDCDEITDNQGTNGGIRELCEKGIKENIDCFSFQEVTLFCSETWYTTKYLVTYFNRLWKNNGKLKFNVVHGLHNQLFPNGFQNLQASDIKIIHYGYSSFDAISKRYKEREKYGVPKETRDKALDINSLGLNTISLNLFPKENRPSKIEPNPLQNKELLKKLEDLKNGR